MLPCIEVCVSETPPQFQMPAPWAEPPAVAPFSLMLELVTTTELPGEPTPMPPPTAETGATAVFCATVEPSMVCEPTDWNQIPPPCALPTPVPAAFPATVALEIESEPLSMKMPPPWGTWAPPRTSTPASATPGAVAAGPT
jgi:hypothetical protein